jgi:hypothetical protein
LFSQRWLTVRVQALLSIVAALSACFIGATGARAEDRAGNCVPSSEIAVLSSPLAPSRGAPLRVLFASDRPIDGELSLIAPDGSVAAKSQERRGGPPYFWVTEVTSPAVGKWRAQLVRQGPSSSCSPVVREISVSATARSEIHATGKSVWPIRDTWNRKTENLYSAWIDKLFDAPLEQELSWPALHEVLRDKSRNLLFNYLGLGEDQKGLVYRPDCADLPYFLRAYFAFKMGLPFGYSKCTRGGGGKAPKCSQWWNIVNQEPSPARQANQTPQSKSGFFLDAFTNKSEAAAAIKASQNPRGLVPGFGYYVRTTLANAVHSGSGRTAGNDNKADYYPVPLKQETLRPGTIYADPYGHVLVLVKRIPQTADAAGVLLAVDGQPDGTVARKRFWRGNFLFAQDPALGGPGFKHFRPIVADNNGTLRRLTNAEISKDPEYGDFSLEQSHLGVDEFYDRMDEVMSPAPLDPKRAMEEAITALDEQVKTRVTSVENGRKYQNGGGATVTMPKGASIFETTGAWEDFATPSRDLRLLIAIDVVRRFPDHVAQRPNRYAMPSGKSVAEVKTELESVLASELAKREFTYMRSDGSPWSLKLKDVAERAPELEMAYNVNDCVELRWGAPEKSDEASTCKRHAPAAQRAKMSEYRAWFHERRRPARS